MYLVARSSLYVSLVIGSLPTLLQFVHTILCMAPASYANTYKGENMFVIVEGPDGAGKSTLIESARQKHRYFVRVQSSGPPPSIIAGNRWLRWLGPFPKELNLVSDRIPVISERISGPILRDIDLFEQCDIDYGLAKVDVIVYCRPPNEVLLRNAAEGVHLAGVSSRQAELVSAYDRLMERPAYVLPVVRFEFTLTSARERGDYMLPRAH